MTYPELREQAQNGDVILLEGSGFVSKFIRVFTGQSISHVALLVWLDSGLFIAEMIEGVGYQIKPASERIPAYKGIVYYGKAPKVVNDSPGCILKSVLEYRADKSKQRYGYFTLFSVWWSQIRHKNIEVKKKVCSTFIADVWNWCRFKFSETPDPGNYVNLCQFISKVDREV